MLAVMLVWVIWLVYGFCVTVCWLCLGGWLLAAVAGVLVVYVADSVWFVVVGMALLRSGGCYVSLVG